MAVTARQEIRVALVETKRVDRQSQHVGRDLGIGGLVPLAVGLRADGKRHRTVRLERGAGELGRHAAGGFEETGNARCRAAGRP